MSKVIDDGWGDDDLSFDLSETNNDTNNSINEIHRIETEKSNEGCDWEFDDSDDDDDDDVDDTNDEQLREQQQQHQQNHCNAEDEPKNIHHHPYHHSISSTSTTTNTKSIPKLVQKLTSYINDLHNPSLLQTLNHNLQTQCNTPDAALQLCHYYHDRPALRDYTLNSELSRMDYQLMISDDLILTTEGDIQDYFRDHPVSCLVDDMLLRASNQSLLADIFPILTGSDDNQDDDDSTRLIRSCYMASAVATNCRFVLDMRDHSPSSVHVQSTLKVCIPTNELSSSSSSSNNSKLEVASLRVSIQFSPEPSAPFVNYQIESIVPLLDAAIDTDRLRCAAEFLDGLLPNELDIFHSEQHPSSGNLRDNFLESFSSTHSGLKSALRDIDNVVNVSSKFNFLTSAMPGLLSAEEIRRAEQEVGEHNVDGHEVGVVVGAFPRPPDEGGVVAGAFPRPPDEGGVVTGAFPRPPPQQQQQQSMALNTVVGTFPRPPPPPLSSSSLQPMIQTVSSGIPPPNNTRQQPPPPTTTTSPQPPSPSISTTNNNNNNKAQPEPIIGGFFLKGISRLAKAAASQVPIEGNVGGGSDTQLYRTPEEEEVVGSSSRRAPVPPPPPPSSLIRSDPISQVASVSLPLPPLPVESHCAGDSPQAGSSSTNDLRSDNYLKSSRNDLIALMSSTTTSKYATTANDLDLVKHTILGTTALDNTIIDGDNEDDDCKLYNQNLTAQKQQRQEEGTRTNQNNRDATTTSTSEDPNSNEPPSISQHNNDDAKLVVPVVEQQMTTSALDTYAPSNFVYQVKDGIIPTRRRFISCNATGRDQF